MPIRKCSLALVVCVACSADSATSTARGVASDKRSASAGGGSTETPLITTSSSGAPSDDPRQPALENCDPGAYVGMYACKLVQQGMPTDTPIDGVVSFDLEVNSVETRQNCPVGAEFCDFDLVIKEGSGKLFGFVLGLVGFETGLRGGLDCRTGKFHADAVGGIYGVPWEDPNEPGKLKVTVELGTFDGTLDGTHGGKNPQIIAGTWNLGEPSFDIYCPGPFSVERMP